MIIAQAASESTPIEKNAARSESRSVRLLSGAVVANELEISARCSLAIFDDFLPSAPPAVPVREEDHRVGCPSMRTRPLEPVIVAMGYESRGLPPSLT
jgi:hypothetical protein